MDIKSFKEKYENDKPVLRAWGEFVSKEIQDHLIKKLPAGKILETFLKIPPTVRIKELDSLISKAFYRGKRYDNPYEQITDKVGIRFVVLLLKDIRIIQNIVEESCKWTFSKDRDFEEERRKNPLSFDYQSVHYIIKSKRMRLDGFEIPENVCCELQIRTLLQHAYSELTHDTIYKPATKASPDVIRAVSKSMALIETTDSIFDDVDNTLCKVSEEYLSFFNKLVEEYSKIVISPPKYDFKANIFIIETYSKFIEGNTIEEILTFLNHKKFISEKIEERVSDAFLFKQPIILFLYKLAYTNKYEFKQYWPFQLEHIQPIFLDLGISID
ncbi:GTP pyrophosphokinase family protein [Thermodesulfobacteriota bacterium B35]